MSMSCLQFYQRYFCLTPKEVKKTNIQKVQRVLQKNLVFSSFLSHYYLITQQIYLMTLWRDAPPEETTKFKYLFLCKVVAPPRPATTVKCCLHMTQNEYFYFWYCQNIFLISEVFMDFFSLKSLLLGFLSHCKQYFLKQFQHVF